MIGWLVAWKCAVACLFGELSQQPTCPQVRQIRRWTHQSPVLRHSSQPRALGVTLRIECKWWQLPAMVPRLAIPTFLEQSIRTDVTGEDINSPGKTHHFLSTVEAVSRSRAYQILAPISLSNHAELSLPSSCLAATDWIYIVSIFSLSDTHRIYMPRPPPQSRHSRLGGKNEIGSDFTC